MPRSARETLVRLARKFDALIICDDVYDFVYWDASTTSLPSPTYEAAKNSRQPFIAVLPRLVDIDRTLDPVPEPDAFGNVLSNGSFSKIVAPGVRTGWVQSSTAPLAHSISQAGVTRSGGAASNLTGTVLAQALRSGALEEHMRETLAVCYARRWRLLVVAVQRQLVPLGVKLAGGGGHASEPEAVAVSGAGRVPGLVAGGFFIWLELPSGLTDGAVAARGLRDANVAVATETQCRLPLGNGQRLKEGRFIRLCFAFEPEEKMAEGVERLKGVFEDMLREVREGRVENAAENGPNVHEYA
jgi:DNA-binding transcriptional MocR family regulator